MTSKETAPSKPAAADNYLSRLRASLIERRKGENWGTLSDVSNGVFLASLVAGFVVAFSPLVWAGIGVGLLGNLVGHFRKAHHRNKEAAAFA